MCLDICTQHFCSPNSQSKLEKCVLKAWELPAQGLCAGFHIHCLYSTELHKIPVSVKYTLFCKRCMHLIKFCVLSLCLFHLTSPGPSLSAVEKGGGWAAVWAWLCFLERPYDSSVHLGIEAARERTLLESQVEMRPHICMHLFWQLGRCLNKILKFCLACVLYPDRIWTTLKCVSG